MASAAAAIFGAPSGGITGGDDGGNDSSGWLSGLGDLFAGVGSAVASGIRASNLPSTPSASSWIYNPITGQYHNPVTGQALTATGALPSAAGFSSVLSSGGLMTALVIGLIALLLLRKRS